MAASLFTSVLALALTLLIAFCGGRLRGTTLLGAWLWAVLSGALLTLAPLAAILPPVAADARLATLMLYAAEVSTLCPLAALLGARRPQHMAWQFVVATLYFVLLVPAVQGSQTSGALVIEAPWSWLMLGLVGVGFVNALPTRFWPSAIATALGQLTLLTPYIMATYSTNQTNNSMRIILALALFIGSVMLLRWRATAAHHTAAWRTRDPLDRLWLDFRDAYGVLWALRVQQRINAAAVQYDWPIGLAWDGFRDREHGAPLAQLTAEARTTIETVLRTVLWRFMSPQWIDERLQGA